MPRSLRLLLSVLSHLIIFGLTAQESDYAHVHLQLARAASEPDVQVEHWCKTAHVLGCRIGRLSLARKHGQWQRFDSLLAEAPVDVTHPQLGPYITIERLTGLLERGQFDRHFALSDSLLQLSPKPHLSLLATVHGQRGLIHLYQGDYPSALSALFEARRIYTQLNDAYGLAQTDHNLALVHGATKGYAEALRSAKRAMAEFQRLGVAEQLTMSFNVGNIYALQKRGDSARHFYHRALKLAEADRSRGAIYNAIGAVFVDDLEAASTSSLIAHTDSAAFYLREALGYRRNASDVRGQAYTQLNMARYFMAREHFDSARHHASASLVVADSLQLLDVKRELFALIAKLEAEADRAVSAVNYARREAQLKDSLLGAEQMRSFLAIVNGGDSSLEPMRWNYKLLLASGIGVIFIVFLFIWRHRTRISRQQSTELAASTDAALAGVTQAQAEDGEQHEAVEAELTSPPTQNMSADIAEAEIPGVDPDIPNVVAVERELAEVRRELVAARMELASDEAFYRDLMSYLNQLQPDPTQETLRRLRSTINQHQQFHSNWRDTMEHFRSVQPTFFEELRGRSDSLTPGDVRHAAFVRLGLSAKEVAGMLHVKYTTVEMSRYRLKKKLELGKDEDLYGFLLSL